MLHAFGKPLSVLYFHDSPAFISNICNQNRDLIDFGQDSIPVKAIYLSSFNDTLLVSIGFGSPCLDRSHGRFHRRLLLFALFSEQVFGQASSRSFETSRCFGNPIGVRTLVLCQSLKTPLSCPYGLRMTLQARVLFLSLRARTYSPLRRFLIFNNRV